ncbi:hypothetical protein T492DRAFT_909527 [Pavlovales sp. CCMP2436]|nr:hypothetical protein T492DRAFT_909527 [Pavlovales sp. CCMP2436]
MAMAVKLVYFAIERVTEPVSTFIGTIAERSPVFQAGCRRLARHVDKVAARANIDSTAGAYTHAGLTDEQAAKAGAEILGEGVVWDWRNEPRMGGEDDWPMPSASAAAAADEHDTAPSDVA